MFLPQGLKLETTVWISYEFKIRPQNSDLNNELGQVSYTKKFLVGFHFKSLSKSLVCYSDYLFGEKNS